MSLKAIDLIWNQLLGFLDPVLPRKRLESATKHTWMRLASQFDICLDACFRHNPTGPDGIHQQLVVLFGLVSVGSSELGDGIIKNIPGSQVAAYRSRITSAGMSTRQTGAANSQVCAHTTLIQLLHIE